MPKVRNVATGILLGLGAICSAPACAQDTWSGARHLVSLYPYSMGMTFRVDGPRINVGSPCEENRMFVPLTNPNYNSIISIMIVAYNQNEPIDINYDAGTITQCETLATRAMVSK